MQGNYHQKVEVVPHKHVPNSMYTSEENMSAFECRDGTGLTKKRIYMKKKQLQIAVRSDVLMTKKGKIKRTEYRNR